MDLIVYAGDPSNPSQKYNLEANVSCPVAAFPADVENLVSGQAFGHPMACGGNAINGKLQYSTDTRFSLQIWPVENLVLGQAFGHPCGGNAKLQYSTDTRLSFQST